MTKTPSAAQTDLEWSDPNSLYIHIPFCPYKCPYCDFVTHVGGADLHQPYVDAVCREIENLSSSRASSEFGTVFFGGGTPSMLEPDQVGQMLATVRETFGIASGAEISLEANPDVVDRAKLEGFRAAGVNRLSMGVQSFNPEELRLLGRGHSPDDVGRAVVQSRAAGFGNFSLDLIYGIQKQTMATWSETLDAALSLEPEHLSLYSLIIEPRTVYHRMAERGKLSLPDDDLVADMYLLACERLRAVGFEHYEVANWSKPGFESRHNLTYWENNQFHAVGVGAYDYIRPYRSVRIRNVKRYVGGMEAGEPVIAERDHVTPEIERFETAVMQLRLLRTGLRRRIFDKRFPEGLGAVYGDVLTSLQADGFLIDDGEVVRLKENMVPLANEAWERFLPAS